MSSLALVAGGLGIGGTVIGTISAVNAARFNARVAHNAAKSAQKQAEIDAESATAQAKIGERQERERSKAILGQQRALIGVSGVDIEGSPLAVVAESAKQAEINALNIRFSGQILRRNILFAGEVRRAEFENIRRMEKAKVLPTILGGVFKGLGQGASLGAMPGSGGGATATPTFSQSRSGLKTRSGVLPTSQLF